jgi:hypothetical protein
MKPVYILFAALMVVSTIACWAYASTPDREIKLWVSNEGFRNVERGLITSPIMVKKGQEVQLTFLFDEPTGMMYNTQTHAFSLYDETRTVAESTRIDKTWKGSALTFTAGDRGAKVYQVLCTRVCVGMEHLGNLMIEVAP